MARSLRWALALLMGAFLCAPWVGAQSNRGAQVERPRNEGSDVYSAAFSPHGRRVVTASMDQTARVWDAVTGRPLTPPLVHEGLMRAAFSPDGRRIITAYPGEEGAVERDPATVRIWDAVTGKPLSRLLRDALGISPDGRRAAIAGKDQPARVVDTSTGRPLTPPLTPPEATIGAAFSPDGRRLVTAGKDGTARVWDALTGRAVTAAFRHAQLAAVEFSGDGRRIVTLGKDKEEPEDVRIWDAATGKPAAAALRLGRKVTFLACSPDGRQIVTADQEEVRGWDVRTGKPILPIFRHDDAVVYAAFSPDGRRLVTTTAGSGEARVWDVVTGLSLARMVGHSSDVHSAAFSPDGRRIVTAGEDGTAQVWDAATGAPVSPPLVHGPRRMMPVEFGAGRRAPGEIADARRL